MEQSFATSITPVLNAALDLLEDIQKNPGDWELGKITDAQNSLKKTLEKAQRKLQPLNESSWKLVKYAFIAWIDEQCVSLPWRGQEWWKNNSLEVQYFRSKNSHNDFYVYAEEAIRKNDRNAIEAFFLCVVLGFRGIYIDLRSKDTEYRQRAHEFIQRYQLKSDLRDWLKRASEFLPIGESANRLNVKKEDGYGASPLGGRSEFILAFLFGLVGLSVLIGKLMVDFKVFEWLDNSP